MKLKFPRINPRMFAPALAIATILVVAVLMLAWAGKINFTIVPSFGLGSAPSINSTGVYVASGALDTGWQNYYSVYAFKLDSATVGGQDVQLTVPTHAMGNGVYGIFKCPYTPSDASVYYILTGTGMATPDTWKIFNINNPTTTVTVNYQYNVREAVNQDGLNNVVYDLCGGGYDLQGNPTGSPIRPFSGTAVSLSKNFGSTPLNQTPQPTCGDRTCNGAETCSSCSSDCGQCAAPAQNQTTTPTSGGAIIPEIQNVGSSTVLIIAGIIALGVIGTAGIIYSRKK